MCTLALGDTGCVALGMSRPGKAGHKVPVLGDELMEPDQAKPSRRGWNFTPALPLKPAPYWHWPLRPLAAGAYLLRSWNPLGTRCLFLVAAILVWAFFTPDLARMQRLAVGWVAEIWVRNAAILLIVAGGLHVLLWGLKVQGAAFRYDMRPLMRGPKTYFFRNQVWDNVLWSCVALQFWTLFEVLMWLAYANAWVTPLTFAANPILCGLLIALVPIWAGFYFYAHHRLLHTKFLFRYVHSWHHKNLNTGPWSGLAMHPVESFILMTDVLIFLIVPAHPVHILFLMFHHGIGAPTSHAGFDKLKIGKRGGIAVGDFFHQLHHRFFDCNYGTYETPWDQWFGTFHDGTEDGPIPVQQGNRRHKEINHSRSLGT